MLVLVVSLWSCSTVSSLMSKIHMYIQNGLGPNNTLTVHCKSKDNDLGEHSVDFHQNISWSFTENPFYTTLFWCRIWWYDHHRLVWVHNDMFDSSKPDQDMGCMDGEGAACCIRRAQWDGVYFVQWDGKFKKIYNWIRE
ncbi:hypothetical protein AQUCO_03300022v1 [Aquilegia coerulea]|uniref:S-protein homolog n=1 Tax=Aquilegia coerulea TaxID=218851 RepID=A0A2G5CZ54_AQUCA|nr:hypothetical protein AQUCO_03300022v1 [Aquilegia coerulea]